MKFYGQAEVVATRILEAFENNTLPKALAHVFIIAKNEAVPCHAWSWSNRLAVALAGFDDARGFKQWKAVGRSVKKGQKAFPILVPLMKKITECDDAGNEKSGSFLYGFKSAAVFGLEQTEGEPLATGDDNTDAFIESLPMLEVAQAWGITVRAIDGRGARFAGQYDKRGSITLCVENLSTWAHELIHAADDRNIAGGLKGGQRLDQEVVAELGGAILLELLGHEVDADRGGCWDYVKHYAEKSGKEPLSVCQSLLNRTCEAVALILATAETLKTEERATA